SPVFFGKDIPSKKISYAPSVNNSNLEQFIANTEYVRLLCEIDSLSVRDHKSKEIIEELTGKKTEIVLDPTLLTDPPIYKIGINEPYIAVYVFEANLSDKDIDKIRGFAKKHKMKLVACGVYLEWCDYCIHSKHGTPFYLYYKAEYVITNTFHGTAFAINYKKNFISIVNNNDKIINLLKEYGIDNRGIKTGEDLEQTLLNEINYEKIEQTSKQLRIFSVDFIKKSIYT
ncbi:MAG TPA: polysaccharide pyruvyl transferase family protein, partial [Gallicola sp.]|nr:polysaccharide pyruvyl transferase family protein [Gallicola sp.]